MARCHRADPVLMTETEGRKSEALTRSLFNSAGTKPLEAYTQYKVMSKGEHRLEMIH